LKIDKMFHNEKVVLIVLNGHEFTAKHRLPLIKHLKHLKYRVKCIVPEKSNADKLLKKNNIETVNWNISRSGKNIFKEIKTKFYETFPKPDLLIYLQASPKQIFERVRKRGRTYEDSISLNYLENVCEKYAEFFFNYSESPLLVLNVDNVDFMANKLDLAKVIDCLKKEIVGKEFINLAPGFF